MSNMWEERSAANIRKAIVARAIQILTESLDIDDVKTIIKEKMDKNPQSDEEELHNNIECAKKLLDLMEDKKETQTILDLREMIVRLQDQTKKLILENDLLKDQIKPKPRDDVSKIIREFKVWQDEEEHHHK